MKKHLVLVGGGHAHLTVLKHLNRFTSAGYPVTVISAEPWHYYSGMGPGMLSGVYSPEEIRFNVKKMVEDRGGRFIADRVIRADTAERRLFLKNSGDVTYDTVSFNTGSAIPFEVPPEMLNKTVFPVKPIESLLDARCLIIRLLKEKRLHICVAGGGAAGVETAANVRDLVQREGGKADITLLAGSGLLYRQPEKLHRIVRNHLEKINVAVKNLRLQTLDKKGILLSDDSVLEADITFLAVGTSPSSLFQASGIPAGDDGGLLVNDKLQSIRHPEIFGGGDCITFAPRPLDRVGVYAVRQNPILMNNLFNAVTGKGEMQDFNPQQSYLLILNMGGGKGIFLRKNVIFQGRTAFRLKDAIDRKFMRQFQVSGERG